MKFGQMAVVAIVMLVVFLGSAFAEPSPEQQENRSLFHRETLTDDWFGFGSTLSEQGLTVSLGLTQLYQQNAHGATSTHRRAGRYSGRYDLEIQADLETLLGLNGASIYALARGGWSDGIGESSVASLFGVNSLACGYRSLDIWQLYYEQSFLDGKAFLRVGKIDLTGGFDENNFANDEAGQFLNGSLVNNPTIPFPDPGLGVMLHVKPTDWWYVSAGVADAEADFRETGFSTTFHDTDNFFFIAETGFLTKLQSHNGTLEGTYRFGIWYDPQPKDRFNGNGVKRDDTGFYLSFDQRIFKENADEDDSQGLDAFVRFGLADSSVNEIRCFWSAGLQYAGLIPTRDNDVLGIGIAQGNLSPNAGYSASHETAMELYYNIQITPWMNLTPSVQYITNPEGDKNASNATAVGLRLHINF